MYLLASILTVLFCYEKIQGKFNYDWWICFLPLMISFVLVIIAKVIKRREAKKMFTTAKTFAERVSERMKEKQGEKENRNIATLEKLFTSQEIKFPAYTFAKIGRGFMSKPIKDLTVEELSTIGITIMETRPELRDRFIPVDALKIIMHRAVEKEIPINF